MLAHRLRRLFTIGQTLGRCVEFAGQVLCLSSAQFIGHNDSYDLRTNDFLKFPGSFRSKSCILPPPPPEQSKSGSACHMTRSANHRRHSVLLCLPSVEVYSTVEICCFTCDCSVCLCVSVCECPIHSNTRRWHNARLMLAQRLRRRPNISPVFS